jgi:hypothetical protein
MTGTIFIEDVEEIKSVVFFLRNQYSCYRKYCHREEVFFQITGQPILFRYLSLKAGEGVTI